MKLAISVLAAGLAVLAITGSSAGFQGSGSAPAPKKAIRDPAPPVAATPMRTVAVIPLHGSVGACGLGDEWFSCVDFAAAIAKAEKASIKTIILEIHSPGGFVRTEEKVIKEILEADGRGITFVALIASDAGSAAALIALACKHIYATPAARLGAAVTILSGPNGTVSVEKALKDDPALAAKFLSFSAALHVAAAEAHDRCLCLSNAMCQMEAELWWSPTSGLSATKLNDSTEQVDSKTTVLTLTASQIERFGLGEVVNRRWDVLESLNLAPAKIVEFTKEMDESPRRLWALVKQERTLAGQVADSELREGKSQGGTTAVQTELHRRQHAECVRKINDFRESH